MEGGDHAQRGVAHGRQHVVVGQVAGGDDLDAGSGQAALAVALHEGDALLAGRHEDEHRVGLGVLDALDVRREFRVAQRDADHFGHRAAAFYQFGLEGGFRIDAGAVVGHQGHDFLDVVLGRPRGHRRRDLRQRHRKAGDVIGLGGDRRRGRVHDDHRLLGLLGNRRHGQRFGRQAKAGQEVHLVAHHQFLRQALGDFRRRTGGVLDDDLDFFTGHGGPVLRHVGLDTAFDLLAVIGKRPRKRRNHADLDGVLGVCVRADGQRRRSQRDRGQRCLYKIFPVHAGLLFLSMKGAV